MSSRSDAFGFLQGLGFASAESGEVYLNEQALTALQFPLLDIYQGSREGIAKVHIKAD